MYRVFVVYIEYLLGTPEAGPPIFSSSISNVEFRTVRPRDYRLFQVADLVCTLELVAHKAEHGELSASEVAFFGSRKDLKKNHLKTLERKRF